MGTVALPDATVPPGNAGTALFVRLAQKPSNATSGTTIVIDRRRGCKDKLCLSILVVLFLVRGLLSRAKTVVHSATFGVFSESWAFQFLSGV